MNKISQSLFIIPLFLLCFLIPQSGKLDKQGGHRNLKTGEYLLHSKSPVPNYNRKEDFGSWIDEDHDGQNTRAEVLIEESKIPVIFKTSKHKLVIAGYWICPYTGMVITNAHKLDIDHVVPLKEAWDSGAWKWSKEKRIEYANDLNDKDHLIAVYASANRRKGSKDPAKWLPPNTNFILNYLKIWIQIKSNWGLSMDGAEKATVKRWLHGN